MNYKRQIPNNILRNNVSVYILRGGSNWRGLSELFLWPESKCSTQATSWRYNVLLPSPPHSRGLQAHPGRNLRMPQSHPWSTPRCPARSESWKRWPLAAWRASAYGAYRHPKGGPGGWHAGLYADARNPSLPSLAFPDRVRTGETITP